MMPPFAAMPRQLRRADCRERQRRRRAAQARRCRRYAIRRQRRGTPFFRDFDCFAFAHYAIDFIFAIDCLLMPSLMPAAAADGHDAGFRR